MLSRLRSLKRGQNWREAGATLEQEFQRLARVGTAEILNLSETELFARLLQGDAPQAAREKGYMLLTLLKEAAEVAAGEGRDGAPYLFKALHLVLELLAQNEPSEYPEFAPRVEELVGALGAASLPLETQARLMHHYERCGEFARAEDRLYEMLESAPAHPGLVEFGLAFYDRVQRQSDERLLAGNLPRAELKTGQAELRKRQQQFAATP